MSGVCVAHKLCMSVRRGMMLWTFHAQRRRGGGGGGVMGVEVLSFVGAGGPGLRRFTPHR
jgi:hypothetical protein